MLGSRTATCFCREINSYKLDQLLNDLNRSVQEYLKHEKDGVLSELERKDKTTHYSDTWSRSFINLLIQLPYPGDYHHRLINLLKDYYDGKEEELKTLQKFEINYTKDKAMWWYTRPIFLYRLINKALRQNNIELVFLFGLFIQDLYRQLKDEREQFKLFNSGNNKIIKGCREQVISNVEIRKLKNYCLCSLVNTSFLSTSLDRHVSLSFLQSSTITTGLERVFEIEIDRLINGIQQLSTKEINTIFNQLIDLYPLEKGWISGVQIHCLAQYSMGSKETNFYLPLTNYYQSLEMWNEYLNDDELNCSFNIGTKYDGIGDFYRNDAQYCGMS
ncbi:unnamed protein product [Didymodactylos carnosus]|uniref:Uncharacterized protein n=1 Tax=Didymodactylos carnosus TaxID=1234261 RepID=A0A814XSS4_9BILA|nr:unnamed protein product [Didymodactylos carnosus]CAF3983426.1 unnamed protein product [Didymodactylos carnosus]